MASVSDLRIDVMALLPECPAPIIDRAIRRAARELSESAPIWRVTLDNIVPKADTQEYDLTASAFGGEIVQALEHGIRYDGRPLTLLTQEQAESSRGDWRRDTGKQPQAFVMMGPRRIALLPIPEADLTKPLQISVQLRPSFEGKDIDDAIALDYREGIVHGALWHLFGMPHDSWGSLQMSTYHRGMFLSERRQAISNHARGFVRGNLRVRPRRFVGDTKASYR